MKKSTIFALIIFCIAFYANAQIESSYSLYSFSTKEIYDAQSYSSDYFDGKTYFFIMGPHWIFVDTLTIENDGHIKDFNKYTTIDIPVQDEQTLKLNTVVFNRKLYFFCYNPYPGPFISPYFFYSRFTTDHQYDLITNDPLNFKSKYKMATVAANDTLYMFFAEYNSGEIKYFKGVSIENSDKIHWLSNDPVVLKDSIGNPLVSIGNVAASTYFTPDNKEQIMLLYPGDHISANQNELIFYSGIGDDYSFHHKIASYDQSTNDSSAYFVSMGQGTVKGGWGNRYMMQVAYVTRGETLKSEGEEVKMFRNEFDLTTGDSGGWEQIPVNSSGPLGPGFSMAPDFLEFYVPDGNAQEIRKYLYLIYNFDWWHTAQVVQWKSDLLKLIGHTTELSPKSLMDDLWHPICVIEGPPPFAHNGWTTYELWKDNKYPPSSFVYGQETTHTVGSNTIYRRSYGSSGGFGPITGGFKRAMQHNNENSTTDKTSLSVQATISPPYAIMDSTGLMWFFYDGPSLKRSQWRLHDYNGDTLFTDHSLFLFNFTEPQLNIIKKSFSELSKSPRMNDITSYVERNVDYFPGLTSLVETQLPEYISGGLTVTQSIDFDTLYSNTTETIRTVEVGIDARFKIFSFQSGYTATLIYTTENNTENKQGFKLTYKNPAPKVQEDSLNIRSYNTIAHLMQVKDTSVYFYPGGFSEYKPLFITYEVSDINYGPYCESIDEKTFVSKYNFQCYPNPASTLSTFSFALPKASDVSLTFYNSTGGYKDVVLNARLPNGSQSVKKNLQNFSPGLYFYTLRIGQDVLNGKLMVVRY